MNRSEARAYATSCQREHCDRLKNVGEAYILHNPLGVRATRPRYWPIAASSSAAACDPTWRGAPPARES
eukprot:scaffold143489_cov133-Phaeocystis_antarctica.AAC.1